MGKILVIASIVVSIATAVIGWKNKSNYEEAFTALAGIKDSLAKTTTQLTKKETELKSAKESLQQTLAEKEQLNTQLTATKGELDRTKVDLSSFNAKIAEKTAEIDKKVAENTALQAKVEGFATKGTGNDSKVKELETQIAENKAVIDGLTDQKKKLEDKVEAYAKKDDSAKKKLRENNFEGRVMAVNQAWNFVVLNLGERNGISSNVEMIVKRGNQLVGKVRVTSVEPSTSIADIVANNSAAGALIQPNDQVISSGEAAKE